MAITSKNHQLAATISIHIPLTQRRGHLSLSGCLCYSLRRNNSKQGTPISLKARRKNQITWEQEQSRRIRFGIKIPFPQPEMANSVSCCNFYGHHHIGVHIKLMWLDNTNWAVKLTGIPWISHFLSAWATPQWHCKDKITRRAATCASPGSLKQK